MPQHLDCLHCLHCGHERGAWWSCGVVCGGRVVLLQEVGMCHMRISEGVDSRLQMSGLLAKMCKSVLGASQ